MYEKSNMETYITIYKIDNGNLLYGSGNFKQGLWISLEGWGREGDGGEFQKGRDICIPMAD